MKLIEELMRLILLDAHIFPFTPLVEKGESMTTYYDRYKPPIIISWPMAFL